MITSMRAMLAICLVLGSLAGTARAGIQIEGTRVVYPGGDREVTVKLANNGDGPRLIQAWVDAGNPEETAETAKSPFTVTPPVARIEAGKGQVLRVFHTGEPLPQDRESVFWLNVLEIPPKPTLDPSNDSGNFVQFAVRNRIKLFFRPKGLMGGPMTAAEHLRWRPAKKDGKPALECINSSAFSVSFNAVGLKGMMKPQVFGGGMVPAFGTQVFALQDVSAIPADAKVSFSVINDQGGFVPKEGVLTP